MKSFLSLLDVLLRNKKQFFLWLSFLILLGAFSAFRLPIQFMPDVDAKSIEIITVWQSATPQEVESEILEPQEEVLDGLPGLKRSNAYAARGTSWLSLEFESNTNMDETMIDVVGRISRVTNLPRAALPPQIMSGGESGSQPTLTTFYLQTSDQLDPQLDIQSVVEKIIRPRLESVSGIARVSASRGLGAEEEIYITFNPYEVARLGLQINDISNALVDSFDVSGGFIDLSRRRYNMRYLGKVSLQEMENMIISWRRDTPVYLKEVAEVKVGRPNAADITYVNGERAIAINVQRERGASSLKAIDELKQQAQTLNQEVLQDLGLQLRHTYDTSEMIGSAIQFVIQNIGFGILAAVLPVWWFFRNRRTTLLIAVAIPVSIVLTFIVLYFGGRTLNVISLAGLAFATGMVLDASIVVMESIFARRSAGDNVADSAKHGTKKVFLALLASTVTTVSVFTPVLFVSQSEVQIFVDLAFTIAVSVVISLLVAITLVPILSTQLVKDLKVDAWQSSWQRVAKGISNLTKSNRRCALVILSLVAGSVLLLTYLMPSSDYLPSMKRPQVNTAFYLPSGTNPQYVENVIMPLIDQRIAPLLAEDSELPIKNYTISMESSFSMNFSAEPVNPDDAVKLEQILRDDIFANLPDLWTWVNRQSVFSNLRSMDTLDVYIQGSDMAVIASAAESAMVSIQEQITDVVVYPAASFSPTEIEVSVTPDVSRMSQLGFTRQEVMRAVQAFGNGIYLNEYYDGNRRRNLVLRAESWQNFSELRSYPVVNSQGFSVPIGELVEVKQNFGPAVIQHINLDRSFILTVEPPGGMSLEELHQQLEEKVMPGVIQQLPAGYAVNYGGSADSIKTVKLQMVEYFIFSAVLLFLIMAGLFRSISDSVLVMLTVPLATVGGAGMLKFLNLFVFQPLDIISMVGFVILLGLVVNNAILLVYGVRSHEATGLDRATAVELSIASRLRPILLSTITSVFGMLPLLLLPGTGSEIYRGLAAAIVGGMMFSGVFTLILLPALMKFKLVAQKATPILNTKEL